MIWTALTWRFDIKENHNDLVKQSHTDPTRWRQALVLTVVMLAVMACSLPTLVKETVVDDLVLDTFGPVGKSLYLLAAIGGALLLFAGWKIYRFIVALPGFFIGAFLSVQIAFRMDQSGWIALLALLIGGMLGAWLALMLHDLAIFAVGVVGGTFLAAAIWNLFSSSEPTLLFEIVAAIVGGVLLLTMAKAWMMLLSAAVGATMFVWGVQISVTYIPLFFLLGIVVQSLLSRAMGEKAYEEEPIEEQPPQIT